MNRPFALLVSVILLFGSCVSKKEYQALEKSKADAEALNQNRIVDCNEKNAALLRSIADLEGQRGKLEKTISSLKDTIETCHSELQENLNYIRNLGKTWMHKRKI